MRRTHTFDVQLSINETHFSFEHILFTKLNQVFVSLTKKIIKNKNKKHKMFITCYW